MLRMSPINSTSQLSSPIQALDLIDFESKLKKGEIELVTFKSPHNVEDAIKLVKKREKFNIMATNTLSSLGLGLSCTIGILLKFTAPLAFGGAAFAIATPVMIGLTCGAGLLALGLALLVHKFYTKEAIKNNGILRYQLKVSKTKIPKKAVALSKKMQASFTMLLNMKLSLAKLKSTREKIYPHSLPSVTERRIEKKINEYINFLVHDPNHPNINLMEDPLQKQKEIEEATERQRNIRIKLDEACYLIQNNKTTIIEYTETNAKNILDCYPSLHLISGAKEKVPPVINKPAVGFSFLGAFSGTFGLSYLSIALITTFTVLPIAFPPLYAIIGLSLLVATWSSYTVYQIKKIEARRNTKLENRQIHLSYYYKNDKLYQERYCRELEHYANYQPDIIRELEEYSLVSQRPPTPDLIKKYITPRASKIPQTFYNEIKFNPQSHYNLPDLVKDEEDLRFNDPSQLNAIPIKTSA